MKNMRRFLIAIVTGAAVAATVGLAPSAHAAPGAWTAAPYLHYGWGGPPDARSVMQATGIRAFTLAFVLSDGTCNPKWDGQRALNGSDLTKINQIRAAGGDVIPSFGGWSGRKLGQYCSSPSALAGAYQKVIDAYKLKSIDIDIEAQEFENGTTQDRVLNALKIVKQRNPGLKTVITMPTERSGPNSWGQRLIRRGAEIGGAVDIWTTMPFNFGSGGDMGQYTIQAVEGLKNQVKSAFQLTDAQAYPIIGFSSMNGKTDTGETVTQSHFRTMVNYAKQKHLARVAFWSVNRDKPGGSGISQGQWEFTKIMASFPG